jgi:chorismate synthase
VLSRIRLLTAGESHGPAVLAVLENMPAGLALAAEDIDGDLVRRQGRQPGSHAYPGASARMGIEDDRAELLAGVMAGTTTGAPIAVRIANRDHASWKDRDVEATTVPRPGHADLAAAVKHRYPDLRFGLERASARETAARVAAGAICRKLLAEFGVRVGGYVTAIGSVSADVSAIPAEARLDAATRSDVRCPDAEGSDRMRAEIREAARQGDTVGGVFEVVALGVPPGLGSHAHWDRRLSSRLVGALVSIPGVKGAEIGDAFSGARRRGTEVHDPIEIRQEDGALVRVTNHAGGLEGGITNGEALVVRAAMKPISTTRTTMKSVDLATGQPAAARYERSDVCAVPRAVIVGEAMVCLVLADALLEKVGGDSISEMRPRVETSRRMRLDDLAMARREWRFWP